MTTDVAHGCSMSESWKAWSNCRDPCKRQSAEAFKPGDIIVAGSSPVTVAQSADRRVRDLSVASEPVERPLGASGASQFGGLLKPTCPTAKGSSEDGVPSPQKSSRQLDSVCMREATERRALSSTKGVTGNS